MRFKKTISVLGCLESYECKAHGCTLSIHLMKPELRKHSENHWYFVISENSKIYTFNSSLVGIMKKSKDECAASAESKLYELIKLEFPNKENNVYCKLFDNK